MKLNFIAMQLALSMLALSIGTASAAATLPPHTVAYEVYYGSRHVGDARFELHAPDAQGTYVYESSTKPRGLAKILSGTIFERSEFSLQEEHLKPLAFASDDGTRRGKRNNAVRFDWSVGIVSSEYKNETHEFELVPGMVDRSLIQLSLMYDLENGRLQESYTIIDRHRASSYAVETLAKSAVVETALGNFDTVHIRYRREGSSRATQVWLASDRNHVTVRVVQTKDGEEQARMELAALEGW